MTREAARSRSSAARVGVYGEALVDLMASEDGSFRPHLGGSPYNLAIGLARHGVETTYLCPLSDDVFGRQLGRSLVEAGVDLAVPRRSRCPTSLAIVLADESGSPAYRLYREGVADRDTNYEEVRNSLPKELRLFHTGSLAITPGQLPIVRPLIDELRGRSVPISLDLNIRLGASRDRQAYLEGVRSLLPLADLVKGSDEDLRAIGWSDARSGARSAHAEMGGGLFLLTEGASGATLLDAVGAIECEAYPVSQVVDTVGAGDTFHAAFLASLVQADGVAPFFERSRDDLAEALDFASAAASINVGRAGCSPPTSDEVHALRRSLAQGTDPVA